MKHPGDQKINIETNPCMLKLEAFEHFHSPPPTRICQKSTFRHGAPESLHRNSVHREKVNARHSHVTIQGPVD